MSNHQHHTSKKNSSSFKQDVEGGEDNIIVTQAASKMEKEGGAKKSLQVLEGTRRRIKASTQLRKDKRLELMNKKRKENDSDFDDGDEANQLHEKNQPKGRGDHRYHEQAPPREELLSNIQLYIDMINPTSSIHQNLQQQQSNSSAASSASGNGGGGSGDQNNNDNNNNNNNLSSSSSNNNNQKREPMDVVREGAKRIRQLLCIVDVDPLPEFVGRGGIEALTMLLDCPGGADIQYDAVWALTNVSSAPRTQHQEDYCLKVINAENAMENMCNLLAHKTSEKVRLQSAWCLGNIAGESSFHRDKIIDADVVPKLLFLINEANNKNIDTMRTAAWLAAQINRFTPKPPISVMLPLLDTLRGLLEKHPDPEVKCDAAWAFSFFSEGGDDRLQATFDSGAAPAILDAFHKSGDESTVLAALRVFGNFAAQEKWTQKIYDWDLLKHMGQFLDIGTTRLMRREVAWLLSNCLCGTDEQIDGVLDAQLVPLIVNNLVVPEFEVRKEATWGIANLALYARLEVIRYMVEECNTIDALCHVLEGEVERACQLALEAVGPILEAGNQLRHENNNVNPYAARFEEMGGVKSLQNLLSHRSNAVSCDSEQLLNAHFKNDDSSNNNNNPEVGLEDGYGDYEEQEQTGPSGSNFDGTGFGQGRFGKRNDDNNNSSNNNNNNNNNSNNNNNTNNNQGGGGQKWDF